jgi:hypothetical protein
MQSKQVHPLSFWTLSNVIEINRNYDLRIDNTIKPALNGPFIKRKSVLNGNIFRSLDFWG